ncbi:hypothetical protein OF113_11540 [Ectopseudomonas chengduensis]|nr:hypothetical protein [Pseudomonas chengduensis]UZT80641.1 hypothetical protein OF113_11540 [Pseudomonas chengduensis]
MNKALIVLGVALALTGCATDYSKKTPAEVAKEVRVLDSEFNAHRLLMAPVVKASPMFGMNYSARLVRSQAKSDGSVTHVLTVDWDYSSSRWMFFSSATLPGARSLVVRANDRHVRSCGSYGSCSYTERVSAIIPLDVLIGLAASRSDMNIRFGSQQGYVDLALPANYVLGYLQGTSTIAEAQRGSASPAPAASRIPKWEAVPTRPAGYVPDTPAKSKEQQLQELQDTQGLSYEEYQRRYRLIMGQ